MVEIQDRSVKSEILMDDLNFDAGNENKYTKKNIMNSVTLHKVKGVKSPAKFVDFVYNCTVCAEIVCIEYMGARIYFEC